MAYFFRWLKTDPYAATIVRPHILSASVDPHHACRQPAVQRGLSDQLVRRKEGDAIYPHALATEMDPGIARRGSTATGWQPHSLRGYLSGTVGKSLV
jgi:hypothetical protein